MDLSRPMKAGDNDQRQATRPAIKSQFPFDSYSRWKDKLRENCYKRVRADRSQLLWKMRLPDSKCHPLKHEELIKSTLQGIVSDELRKIQEIPVKTSYGTLNSDLATSDCLWEYNGLHSAYQGECEEILLEMQRIFYEDLKKEQIEKESDAYIRVWEDQEDEYLARSVFEHMQLNDDKVQRKVWCPICKQGELQQNCHLLFCTLCELKLNRGNEVTLDSLRDRLAEAHAEHLDRGCRLSPKFCLQSRFGLTALYMECQGCNTFEIVT